MWGNVLAIYSNPPPATAVFVGAFNSVTALGSVDIKPVPSKLSFVNLATLLLEPLLGMPPGP